MKFYAVIILLCLLLAGTASAKQAVDIGSSAAIANAAVNPGIYTFASYTDCSDVSASVGTPTDMGDLDVDSTPDGASVSIDGSPWTYTHCIGGWPPICIHSPIFTPYTGNLATGSHSITIALPGYKSYSGTVNICSQKVTSVHKTLATVTTTTPTTSVTTTATTTTATTTAAVTTTATTAVTTSAATTSAASTATTAIATSASIAATTAVVPATTSSVSGMAVPAGSGSLSMITTPAGAAVYIDGVQRGISPATIPGLSEGGHTVLLKLDGYQDLSTPVMITTGTVNEFSTGLIKLPAGTAVPDITAVWRTGSSNKDPVPGI